MKTKVKNPYGKNLGHKFHKMTTKSLIVPAELQKYTVFELFFTTGQNSFKNNLKNSCFFFLMAFRQLLILGLSLLGQNIKVVTFSRGKVFTK